MLLAFEDKKRFLDDGIRWFNDSKVKSLYVVIDNAKLDLAARMVYNCGHGQLRPNIVLIGYKSDWLNCPHEELQSFLNVFKYARDVNLRFNSIVSYKLKIFLILFAF